MKTPAKNQKKQGPGETHGSKATSSEKTKQSHSGKGPWKDPDPTNPKKSPEKINEPFAGTNASVGNKPKPATGIKKEKITNAGESEHHIPVNKSDYENYEEEYEDFELEEEEDDDFDEDEDGETSSQYSYEDEDEDEEDETRFFRSQVKPANQKKSNEQNKLNQKGLQNDLVNKTKSQINSAFNQKLNPQG